MLVCLRHARLPSSCGMHASDLLRFLVRLMTCYSSRRTPDVAKKAFLRLSLDACNGPRAVLATLSIGSMQILKLDHWIATY